MTSIKTAVLWVSAGILLVCLGLFLTTGTAEADRGAPAKATVSAPADAAPAPAQLQQSPAPSKQACGEANALTALSLFPSDGPSASACPTNTVYTCCRCGGCGCRPRNISPTNWCAC